ncbi:glycosyltransferase family 8 protein [Arsenicitalea aurantiaca]|nr:glycosyltransferase family 8 protein [Arsenicitalea aurantiaca]
MPETPRPIHIALTFDDNFWAPAFAVMRSVCITSREPKSLVFHLCHDRLSVEHRRDLDAIATEFGAQLEHYPLESHGQFNALCRGLPVHPRLHTVMYARLLLDHIVPAEVQRIVYLDCDTMVLEPIEDLFDTELHGMPVAAVPDPMRLLHMLGRDMRDKAGIFASTDRYFNSGVMLIDRAGLARADVPARLSEFRARGIIEKLYYDQDMLNLIFRERWHALDWRYNVMDPRHAHQTMGVKILHFTGHNRPWNLFSTAAFARLYRHVMTNELYYRYMRHRWKRFWLKQARRLTGRK